MAKTNGKSVLPITEPTVLEARAAVDGIEERIRQTVAEQATIAEDRAQYANDPAKFAQSFSDVERLDKEIQRLNILREHARRELSQAESREAEAARAKRRAQFADLTARRNQALANLDDSLAAVLLKCEELAALEPEIASLGATGVSWQTARFICPVAAKFALKKFVGVDIVMDGTPAARFQTTLRDPQEPAPPQPEPLPPPRFVEAPAEPTPWSLHHEENIRRAAEYEQIHSNAPRAKWIGR